MGKEVLFLPNPKNMKITNLVFITGPHQSKNTFSTNLQPRNKLKKPLFPKITLPTTD